MKYKIIYIALLLLACAYGQAQKEKYIWHYGYGAGLDFNNTSTVRSHGGVDVQNVPAAIEGFVSTMEGCFTLCDSDGRLLFSSDGTSLYDKDGTVVVTNLGGHNTATQSGIILPWPNDPNTFYILAVGYAYGLKYYSSLTLTIVSVDASRNVTVLETPTLIGRGIEKLAATVNHDQTGYWVLTYDFDYTIGDAYSDNPTAGTQKLNAWLFKGYGVYEGPVTYADATKIPIGPYLGEIAFSNAGDRFVAGFGNGDQGWSDATIVSQVLTGSFNRTTGAISDVRVRDQMPYYGLAFSPSDTYVYVAGETWTPGGSGTLTRYSMPYCAETEGLFAGTSTFEECTFQYGYEIVMLTNIKAGPDGRLYGVTFDNSGSGNKDLYIMENPDAGKVMTAGRFNTFRDYLATPNAAIRGAAGLPVFLATEYIKEMAGEITGATSFCASATLQSYSITMVSGSGDNELTHTVWDWGDGSPTVTDTNIGTQAKSHAYTSRGSYTITVTGYKASGVSFVRTLQVKANACRLPVNHNLTTVGN